VFDDPGRKFSEEERMHVMYRFLQNMAVFLVFASVVMPLTLLAAPHEMADGTVMLGGMEVGGTMQKLPEQTVDGIKAIVHLKDIKASMAKLNMPQTHHLLITLVDVQNNKEVVPDAAMVKIAGPTGKESGPIALTVMPRHVGADITLAPGGGYWLKIQVKQSGGGTISYEYKTTIK
jgi:hypothetical protein